MGGPMAGEFDALAQQRIDERAAVLAAGLVIADRANKGSGKEDGFNNPLFTVIFRAVVPLLLGAILTYAISISSGQAEQLKTINNISGQLAGITQEDTNYNVRLDTLSQEISAMQSTLETDGNRITTLEVERHK